MKIGQYLKEGNFSISFEFFPPKTPEGEEDLFQTIKSLRAINPSFVSVTYGAGVYSSQRGKPKPCKLPQGQKEGQSQGPERLSETL